MHVDSIAHLYKAKCNIKYLSACIFHIFFIVYYADKFQDIGWTHLMLKWIMEDYLLWGKNNTIHHFIFARREKHYFQARAVGKPLN